MIKLCVAVCIVWALLWVYPFDDFASRERARARGASAAAGDFRTTPEGNRRVTPEGDSRVHIVP